MSNDEEIKYLKSDLDYKRKTEIEICIILGLDWTAMNRKAWLSLAKKYRQMDEKLNGPWGWI